MRLMKKGDFDQPDERLQECEQEARENREIAEDSNAS